MTTRFRWKAELWSDLLSRRFLVLLFLITLTATQVLIAQTGQNAVIKDTGNHTTNSPSFFDATQFPAADPCLQIQLAFGALPATGGTVDARGLVSGSSTTLTCSVNPIPMGAKGRLLLSAGTYLAQVPWVIQNNDLNIIGTGGGVEPTRSFKLAPRARHRFATVTFFRQARELFSWGRPQEEAPSLGLR